MDVNMVKLYFDSGEIFKCLLELVTLSQKYNISLVYGVCCIFI